MYNICVQCVKRFYFLPQTITYFTEKSKERVKQNVCCKNVRSIWCQLPRIQNILCLPSQLFEVNIATCISILVESRRTFKRAWLIRGIIAILCWVKFIFPHKHKHLRIYQNTKEEDLKQTYLYLHIFEDAFFKSGLAIARWPVGEDERGMGTSQTLANQNIWANEWKYFSKVYIINFFFMLNSCLLNINYVLVIVDK